MNTPNNAQSLALDLVHVAQEEWERPVRDFDAGQEPTPDLIERYFEDLGWQWFLDQYSDGTYTEQWRDKPFQSWCGLFVGWCGRQVADGPLKESVASGPLASTAKLVDGSRWDSAPREPGLQELRAGDIITVGDYNRGLGSHIALVAGRPVNQRVPTIEGNASGLLGDGQTGEGVIKGKRDFADIHCTYRLTLDHWDTDHD